VIKGTIFDLDDTNARFVRVRINSNHGASNVTYAGEFAFGTVVPEPSSFLCLGLVALGFVGWTQLKARLF
jgi:hypothetical protein